MCPEHDRLPETRWEDVPIENLWRQDGYWIGPRDLRFFLRRSWPMAALYLLFLTPVTSAMIALTLGPSAPFAITGGVLVWLGLMFAFSRGWVAQGDGP